MVEWRGGVGGSAEEARWEWDLAFEQHAGMARDGAGEGAAAVWQRDRQLKRRPDVAAKATAETTGEEGGEGTGRSTTARVGHRYFPTCSPLS